MKHFVIMAQIRTGYQLLASLLYSHSKVLSLGEIFVHPKDVRIRSLFGAKISPYEPDVDPVEYVEHTLDPYAEKIGAEILGFKLNYTEHILWDYMKSNDWHIIHLTRRNLLDRLISQKLAIQETKWNFKEYTSTIEISASELHAYSDDSLIRQAKVNDFFNPHSIIYEDLIKNPTKTVDSLLDFLGLPPQQLTSPMIKQRTGPQSQYISNYARLYSELVSSRSPYAKYLTDIPLI